MLKRVSATFCALILGMALQVPPGMEKQAAAADHDDTLRVLIVHAYSQEYPWTVRQHEGFVDALIEKSPHLVDIKSEYLDTKRRPLTPDYAAMLARFLADKYVGYRPDAIYVTDDDGLNFAFGHLVDVFPDAPVFFSGVNDTRALERAPSDAFTGVFEKKEILPNIRLLRSLAEVPRGIVVVGDDSQTFSAIRAEIERELSPSALRSVDFLSSRTLRDLIDGLSADPSRPVVLATLGAVTDGSGQSVPIARVIDEIVNVGPALVISMEDAYLVGGVLGGYVTSGFVQGRTAAALMAAFFEGTPIADLKPVLDSANEYLFDDDVIEAQAIALPPEIAAQARLINPRGSWISRNRETVILIIVALAGTLAFSLFVYLWVLMRKNQALLEQSDALRQSERKRARERQLLEDVERLSQTGGWQWDLATDQLIWSPETYRIHEVPSDHPLSVEKAIEFYTPACRSIITDAVQRAFSDGTPWDLELSIQTMTGKVKAVRATGELVVDDGQPTMMRGSFQDITLRKHHEQDLQAARDDAQTANRAKSEFLAAMSHELRTPLNAIIGFAEMINLLELNPKTEGKFKEYAQDIRFSGEHLLSLINNILDVSRIEAGERVLHMTTFNAGDMLDECLMMSKTDAHNKTQTMAFDPASRDINVYADRQAMRQILLNLISNAIKFTPTDGRIALSVTKDNDASRFVVTDNGQGIAPDKLSEIARPFSRSERDPYRSVEGWGLGLAICKSLSEAHGGSMHIESQIGHGTTVTVSVPNAPGAL